VNSHLCYPLPQFSWRGFVREVLPACADRRIAPVIDKVFAFAELPAAKAYVGSNAQLGKVVVRIS
jgi:NADPH:quinone reductase